MDGWEATALIKADPSIRDIPVIAITAHAMDGERERALAAGCDLFMTKPIQLGPFFALLDRFLKQEGT